MSDELRQAAERLYEYVTREIDDFTDEAAELDEEMGEELRQVLRDTLKLARNYLAEHPADGDELIDDNWLEEIGGKLTPDGGRLFLCGTRRVVVYPWSTGRRAFLQADGVAVMLRDVTTRTLILRLFEAMGAQPKEPQ